MYELMFGNSVSDIQYVRQMRTLSLTPSRFHWLTVDPQCRSGDQTYPNPTETTIQHCGATAHSTLRCVGDGQRRWGRQGVRQLAESERLPATTQMQQQQPPILAKSNILCAAR